jgi:hypothetical protein
MFALHLLQSALVLVFSHRRPGPHRVRLAADRARPAWPDPAVLVQRGTRGLATQRAPCLG